MTSQMQEPRIDTTHKRKRPSWANPFVAIIIMLLIVLMIIMVLLVLSSLGVIVITWANNLSTVFVGIIIPVLGIVITLAQWLHSLSSHKPETSSTSPAVNLLADASHTVSSHPSTQQVAGSLAHSSVPVQSSPPAQIAEKLIDVNVSNKDHNNHRVDWGEAPDPGQFYGRDKELAALQRWVVQDHCRVVAVLGMGGLARRALP
jgi:hypothetical protein